MQSVGGYQLFQFIGNLFMPRKSDLCDYNVQLHAETDKAWMVSEDGNKDDAVWIPKSQAELEPHENGKHHILTLPEWLAIDKGLA